MSALFRPWPDHGSLPDSTTEPFVLKAVRTAGSEAMFRRVSSAGFQQPRLSVRVNRGVLLFVIAVRKIQLCLYYTQPPPGLSSAGKPLPLGKLNVFKSQG